MEIDLICEIIEYQNSHVLRLIHCDDGYRWIISRPVHRFMQRVEYAPDALPLECALTAGRAALKRLAGETRR